MKYAIIIESKETLYNDGRMIATRAGEKFWVTQGEWGPSTVSAAISGVVGDPLLFSTKQDAEKFARKWKGHPWMVVPNGNYEIVELKPHYVSCQKGYERA